MSHTDTVCSDNHGKDLKAVFRPKSVAVVGASANPSKIGHQVLANIIGEGFTGEVYPVHPKEEEILGKQAYKSVLDVPGILDLVVVCVPAPLVQEVVEQCGEKGVKGVAVITSGFAEVGKLEEELKLKETADRYKMAMFGPNMFGIVYAPTMFNASFGPRNLMPGRIAFISQSGALAIALMGWTLMEKIGLASLINLGNKADIEEKELIEYFNDDDNVDVVLIYMEGIKNGRKFLQTKVTKPVVVLKVGKSKRGAAAAASHTGSLAGADRIYDAAFKQLGILRASTFTEAFGWSRTLSLPAPDGEDTIIITNGGGIGVRTTDACEAEGIELLQAPEWLEEQFRCTMPDFGSTKNPVDVTGQAKTDHYRQAARIAFQQGKIHAVIILYCETVITDPLEIAKAIKQEYDASGRKKPVVMAMVGGERTRSAIQYLNEHRIPSFSAINEAVSALKVLHTWKDIRTREQDKPLIEPAPDEVVQFIEKCRNEGRTALLEHEARRVLELCGIPTPRWGFASNVDEAVKTAEGMYPLAMKIVSEDILHKTEVGGVVLNILNEEGLRVRYQNLMDHVAKVKPSAKIEGVNLIQMVKGIECIVGMNHDPQFGPVVMFGLGGVFVEALKDVSFRIVPFGEIEAGRLIRDIKGQEILHGFRGMQAHIPSVLQTLCAIQKLAPLVKEVDINPLMTSQAGSFAVDARIIL